MASSVDLLVLKAYWRGSRQAGVFCDVLKSQFFDVLHQDGVEGHRVVVIKTRQSRLFLYRNDNGCLETANSLP